MPVFVILTTEEKEEESRRQIEIDRQRQRAMAGNYEELARLLDLGVSHPYLTPCKQKVLNFLSSLSSIPESGMARQKKDKKKSPSDILYTWQFQHSSFNFLIPILYFSMWADEAKNILCCWQPF